MKKILMIAIFLPILRSKLKKVKDSSPDITLVPPPPKDLSYGCKIDNPKHLPDPWHKSDNITETVDSLITGKPLEKFDGIRYELFRKTHDFCDFLTSYEPLEAEWFYVPAVCVPALDCVDSKPFILREWGNKTCREVGHNAAMLYPGHISPEVANTFVCCPINGTRLWQHYLVTHKKAKPTRGHTEFAEVPTTLTQYQDVPIPYYHVAARNYEYLKKTDQDKLKTFFERLNFNAFSDAEVCGFIRGDSIGDQKNRKIYPWYPYICVKPEECGKAKESGKTPLPPANPLWHQFCLQMFDAMLNPRQEYYDQPKYLFPVTNKRHFCCHINDVGTKFLKNPEDEYVAVPQIPTFLRPAPGLRSVYKCEEYAKRVCRKAPDGSPDLCVGGPFTPPKAGENPHMASVGVIIPKIMIFHCGGALVSVRYVVSTASCMYWWGYKVNVVMLGEHASSSYEYGKERFLLVTEIVQPFGSPPFFRPGRQDGKFNRTKYDEIDLGLYKLEVEIQITRYIRPACLWYGHDLGWPNRTAAQFLGWGSKGTYRSEYLNTMTGLAITKVCTSVSFFRDMVENPYYGHFGAPHPWMVCMKDPTNPKKEPDRRVPCLLDLGGPLQEKMTKPYCSSLILGVLSSRNFCTRIMPSVFINITIFLEALEDELWGNYTFLDLTKNRFAKPTCGKADGFFFFNKCDKGDDC